MAKIRNPNIADDIGNDKIKSLHLYVPSNIEGLTLESGTAELTVISDNAADWAKDTPFEVYDNTMNLFGRYYVDECTKVSPRTYEIKASDIISRLEEKTFYGYLSIFRAYSEGSASATPKTAAEICADIFDSEDDYEIDADIADTPIYGVIPYTDCREALRYLCLAVGACAHTFRSGGVKLLPYTKSTYISVSTDLLFSDLSVDKRSEYATGIKMTTHTYAENPGSGTGLVQVFSCYLPKGIHVITKDTNVISYSTEWGASKYTTNTRTILASAPPNMEHVLQKSTGVCTVVNVEFFNGSTAPAKYIDGVGYYYVRLLGIPVSHSTKSNVYGSAVSSGLVKDISTDATVITAANSEAIAARILTFMSKKQTANFTFVLGDEEISSVLVIPQTKQFDSIRGRILSLDIDMGTSKNFAKAVILSEEESV